MLYNKQTISSIDAKMQQNNPFLQKENHNNTFKKLIQKQNAQTNPIQESNLSTVRYEDVKSYNNVPLSEAEPPTSWKNCWASFRCSL